MTISDLIKSQLRLPSGVDYRDCVGVLSRQTWMSCLEEMTEDAKRRSHRLVEAALPQHNFLLRGMPIIFLDDAPNDVFEVMGREVIGWPRYTGYFFCDVDVRH